MTAARKPMSNKDAVISAAIKFTDYAISQFNLGGYFVLTKNELAPLVRALRRLAASQKASRKGKRG
jgi:hypothetical protein